MVILESAILNTGRKKIKLDPPRNQEEKPEAT